MRHLAQCLLAISVVLAVLAACSGSNSEMAAALAPPPEQDASSEQTAYTDPFAYCAAVGTVDEPGVPYSGPPMPDAIVQGMIRVDLVSADAPAEFRQNAVWRCMDGKVWVCHFGANLPCQEKADSSREPSEAMLEFCSANPAAEVIPAAVTGRATVYEWRCSDGEPLVVSQLFESDPRGYLADFWHELSQE